MKPDTFYFPHDYEPTSDPKMHTLVCVHGFKGYGLFWRIVEMLHSDPRHRLPLKDYLYIALADQGKMTVDEVRSLINYAIDVSELFFKDEKGEFFWSARVDRNIKERMEIAKIKSDAGKASAKKRKERSDKLLKYENRYVLNPHTEEEKGEPLPF
jgi:hypothetical protein